MSPSPAPTACGGYTESTHTIEVEITGGTEKELFVVHCYFRWPSTIEQRLANIASSAYGVFPRVDYRVISLQKEEGNKVRVALGLGREPTRTDLRLFQLIIELVLCFRYTIRRACESVIA